jgi:hypothetical protein
LREHVQTHVGKCCPDVLSPAIADGLVFVTTDRIWAFPLSCATGVRICKPVWVSPALGSGLPLTAPTVTRNAVYVSSSGRLFAFAIPTGSRAG